MKKNKKQSGLHLLGQGTKTVYPDNPDDAVLESFPNPAPERDYWIRLDCPEFTSLCPITGQPDFGRLVIDYIPNARCVESKALKLYLFSFRNHGAFHEAVTNRILDDLVRAIRPRKARVTGTFNRRGGIGIEVTAEHPKGARRFRPAES
jgi:7-cyano-7-deazaguanine reductase